MNTSTIRQSVTLQADPTTVYETLMNARKHAQLTGAPASISCREGGHFSVCNNAFNGTIEELVPNKRIVQSWRMGNGDGWPKSYHSHLILSLESIHKGTKLKLRQTGVPNYSYKKVKKTWKTKYWEPMKTKWKHNQ